MNLYGILLRPKVTLSGPPTLVGVFGRRVAVVGRAQRDGLGEVNSPDDVPGRDALRHPSVEGPINPFPTRDDDVGPRPTLDPPTYRLLEGRRRRRRGSRSRVPCQTGVVFGLNVLSEDCTPGDSFCDNVEYVK